MQRERYAFCDVYIVTDKYSKYEYLLIIQTYIFTANCSTFLRIIDLFTVGVINLLTWQNYFSAKI